MEEDRRTVPYGDREAGSAHPVQRFSNTQEGSEPFRKSSTLFLFSTGYKSVNLIRSDRKRLVLIVQPLQFHDSVGKRCLESSPGIRSSGSSTLSSHSYAMSARHLAARRRENS